MGAILYSSTGPNRTLSRSTLLAFLTLLGLLVVFSALTGAASLVWKPESSATARRSGDKRDGRALPPGAEAFDEGDDEDAAPNPDGFPNGTLTGQVTDARTGAALEGVEVTAVAMKIQYRGRQHAEHVNEAEPGVARATTDVNGRYSIVVPPAPWKAQVTFVKTRYRPRYENVAFHGEKTLDVALNRSAFLIGTVTDARGKPVSQCTVNATKQGFLGILAAHVSSSYSLREPFEFDLTPGTWTVTVTSGPLVSKPVKVTMGRNDVRMNFVVEEPAEEAPSGVDPSGR